MALRAVCCVQKDFHKMKKPNLRVISVARVSTAIQRECSRVRHVHGANIATVLRVKDVFYVPRVITNLTEAKIVVRDVTPDYSVNI